MLTFFSDFRGGTSNSDLLFGTGRIHLKSTLDTTASPAWAGPFSRRDIGDRDAGAHKINVPTPCLTDPCAFLRTCGLNRRPDLEQVRV